MSNSILTNYELGVVVNLIGYLREKSCGRLAQRLERSMNYARCGAMSRNDFFSGVCRDAIFRGVELACKERDHILVSDFADLFDYLLNEFS